MHGRIGLLTLALLTGCTDVSAPVAREAAEQVAELASSFDANSTGVIRGQVFWDGAVPIPQESVVRAHATNPSHHTNPTRFVLPNYPKVDGNSKGVENAVVFLRKVELQTSKPWDHAPVRVEFHQRQLHVVQGARRASIGFVRRGGVMESVNRDTEYHNLLGRGAAFFALPLIEKDQISKRTLTQSGIVALSSANGYFWMHAHLFVIDHPYFVSTDNHGRFELDQVPAGKYELVCWLPNWHVRRREHDPETGTLTRLAWESPKEQTQRIEVQVRTPIEAEFRWTKAAFDPKN